MEPNLKELANKSISEVLNGDILEPVEQSPEEHCKVKLFKVSYDHRASSVNAPDGKQEIENQLNEFLSTIQPFMVQSVDIKVVKNFLPHTQTGEYEEIWYGIVVYEE